MTGRQAPFICTTIFTVVLAFLTASSSGEILLSNLSTANEATESSPFDNGNGKAVDFAVSGGRPFEVSEIVLRLKLTETSQPVLRLVEKATHEQSSSSFSFKVCDNCERTDGITDVVFVPEEPILLWPNREYRVALSTESEQDQMTWLSGSIPKCNEAEARHVGQVYGQGTPELWNSRSQVVNLYEVRGQRSDKTHQQPRQKQQAAAPPTRALISNLHLKHHGTSIPINGSRGRAVDFKVEGHQPFEVDSVTLKLYVTPSSQPELVLVGTPRAWADEPVGLNQAAGLGIGGPQKMFVRFDCKALPEKAMVTDVVFTPEQPLVISPGIWRLALSSGESQDGMKWIVGQNPIGIKGQVTHLHQASGQGDPAAWDYGRDRVRQKSFTESGIYSVNGKWLQPADPKSNREISADAARSAETQSGNESNSQDAPKQFVQFSGIYPHLAMFNTAEPTECGIGVVQAWAESLWVVTYSPHNGYGSPDKLFRIDSEHQIYVHPDSVGGTPANRMIHRESNQLIIGSHFIDSRGKVRTIPHSRMPGRMTGTARHLVDPANKVYFASMEEGFYEVDVHSLDVTVLEHDTVYNGGQGFAFGNHGKGLYSGQGCVFFSNNGGHGHNGNHLRKLNQAFKNVGSLNQWDGVEWSEVHRTGFLDISGPGGIRGNTNLETDPVWAIGWDHRSVILKVLDSGKWHTYRLPKASHTMDGPHGFNTEWPRIGEIGSDKERLIYVHGMFWRIPTTFSTIHAGGLRPRSTYLKMVSDSTKWGEHIVFGCNDLSNEQQAIRLNKRAVRGNLVPSISHSNLWFVEPETIDNLGVPIGRGSVWSNDSVKADEASDAYQFAGWDHQIVHLAHNSNQPISFAIEFDIEGDGQWKAWKSFTVPSQGYLPVSLADAPRAEWVRLRPDKGGEAVSAVFHYARRDNRQTTSSPMFDGIASGDDAAVGGLVRVKSSDGAPLGLVTAEAYYEMGTDLKLHRVDDPSAARKLRTIAKIPTGGITSDAASVLYIDDEDGKRYRLPRGRAFFEQKSPLGPERIDREVCRERNLFNTHGTLYELPYRNAGGFSLIRPITTHNRRIKDYCSWRGLFVMTGIDAHTTDNDRIIRSLDGKAAVWLGAVDDLWKMGKVVGIGGPWKNTAVKAGIPSDQYLMTGYDRKTLTLSHQSDVEVTVSVEVDISGYGDWKVYRDFKIPSGELATHRFPDDFNAYWIRTVSDRDTTATAQLRYE